MIELWEKLRSDRLLLAAVIVGAVDLWFAVALVDVRFLLVLPLIAGATYAMMRVRGPVEQPTDDVDDWY
jgi:hypothetical protein